MLYCMAIPHFKKYIHALINIWAMSSLVSFWTMFSDVLLTSTIFLITGFTMTSFMYSIFWPFSFSVTLLSPSLSRWSFTLPSKPWMMLLWTLICKCLCRYIFSFLSYIANVGLISLRTISLFQSEIVLNFQQYFQCFISSPISYCL